MKILAFATVPSLLAVAQVVTSPAKVPIDPLPPPIIACPLRSETAVCCKIFGPLAGSSAAAAALSASGVVVTNSSSIIGVGCFPFPLSATESAVIGICRPICCPIVIPLAGATDGEQLAINCIPTGPVIPGPIPGPVPPITAL